MNLPPELLARSFVQTSCYGRQNRSLKSKVLSEQRLHLAFQLRLPYRLIETCKNKSHRTSVLRLKDFLKI